MPASTSSKSSTNLDARAYQSVGTFGTGSSTSSFPLSQAESIKKVLGMSSNTAVIKIPLASQLDERAPTVSLVDGGPMSTIKIGMPVIVRAIDPGGNDITMFVGYVQRLHHNLSEDAAEVVCVDARWLLEAKPIIGSFWASGSAGISYRQGEPFWVSRNGFPNKVWRNGIPVLCPPNFGLMDGEKPSNTNDKSPNKASDWDTSSLLLYFHFCFTEEARAMAVTKFPFYPTLPLGLEWKQDYASAVTDENAAVATTRKSKESVYAGVNVLQAITTVLQAAGPYAVYIGSADTSGTSIEAKNQLVVRRNKYTSTATSTTTKYIRPTSGFAQDAFSSDLIITGGELVEDGTNLYTLFAASGDRAMVERRVSMRAADNPDAGGVTLEPAVSADRLAEFEAYVQSLLDIYCSNDGDCDEATGTTGGGGGSGGTPGGGTDSEGSGTGSGGGGEEPS